jgi:hypothetical protein
MPLVQRIDEKKFKQKPLFLQGGYKGSGISLQNHSKNKHPLFLKPGLQKEGGAFDFGGLVNTVSNAISQNKDTINAVASSVGSVADFAKSIADNVKVSNELKKVNQAQEKRGSSGGGVRKGKKPVIELTPEERAMFEKMGNGFVTVKR